MNSAASPASPATVELSAAPGRSEAAERAAQLFEESFGYEPDGVWSAPGRVNIIGEHVDYQDGLCLPMAISHRCFAAAARTPTDRLRVRSAQDETVLDIDARTLTPEAVTGWPAYVAGVLWALRSRISVRLSCGNTIQKSNRGEVEIPPSCNRRRHEEGKAQVIDEDGWPECMNYNELGVLTAQGNTVRRIPTMKAREYLIQCLPAGHHSTSSLVGRGRYCTLRRLMVTFLAWRWRHRRY